MEYKIRVGVLGASSFAGQSVISRLLDSGCRVIAFTRRYYEHRLDDVIWKKLPEVESKTSTNKAIDQDYVPFWISIAPIWVLGEYMTMLESYGIRRIVALSSTSLYTKNGSSDPYENEIAKRLEEGESALRTWAKKQNVEWIIVRPTLIYGLGQDKNITQIMKFVRKYRFFPLLGKAVGLRQPVHVSDLAEACASSLLNSDVVNQTYNISGGEVITYREMVSRVFTALGYPLCVLTIPYWVFYLAIYIIRKLPSYSHWSVNMAQRMNIDMAFEHREATRDFGFTPRKFELTKEDIPER